MFPQAIGSFALDVNEPKKEDPGMKSHIAMSRKEEEAHLEEVLSIVEENISSYSGQVEKMQADIDEMLEHCFYGQSS